MNHIERRRNLWYALLTIPPDAREKLGKMRFVQSLGTPNKAEALILAAPLLAMWKAMIREAQGSTNALADEARRWKKHLSEQPALDASLGDEGGMGTLMAYELLEERAGAITKTQGRDAGELFADIATGKKTPTDFHVETWKAQLDVVPKTKDQMIKDLPLLIKKFPALEDIHKGPVKKWLDELHAQGKTTTSLDRILGAARNYWKYLQSSDAVPAELKPFSGVLDMTKAAATKARKRGKVTNLPYDAEDVVRLYKAAITGWGKRPAPDPELAALIKLGAYTGARIEELCSMKIAHVKADSFTIGDSKTAAGIREIPIHSKLKPLIKTLKETAKDDYLIPDLTFNKYGDRSNAIGKRYGRLKEALGFDGSHTFHSFRATVVTQLENAGVPENLASDIVGHEKPTLTYGLYSGGNKLEVQRKALEKVRYPFSTA